MCRDAGAEGGVFEALLLGGWGGRGEGHGGDGRGGGVESSDAEAGDVVQCEKFDFIPGGGDFGLGLAQDMST